MTNLLHHQGLSPACHRHIKRATRAAPDLPLLAALIADVERTKGPLAKNSVNVYAHECGRIISAAVVEGLASEKEAAEAVDRVRAALIARLDENIAPRTSALKVTALTASELGKLFRAVKTKALAEDDMDLGLVGLMIPALAILGVRPVELTTLEEKGQYLRVQTAKRGRTADVYRVFKAHGTPRAWIDAMLLAARIYGEAEDIETFYRVHRRLAQILARISQQILGRRVSFYCLRHIAMATWKRAGISGAEVALLAGHISPRTAQHYAPASAGHVGPVRIKAVAAADVPAELFPERTLSQLIKPPRAPRHRQVMGVEEETLNSETPPATGNSAEAMLGRQELSETAEKRTSDKDHTYRRRSIGGQWRQRMTAKIEDELVIPEMPQPPALPKSKPIDPKTLRFELPVDPEFDAAMAAIMEASDDDINPDFAMPLPYESEVGEGPRETSPARRTDAVASRELHGTSHREAAPHPNVTTPGRR